LQVRLFLAVAAVLHATWFRARLSTTGGEAMGLHLAKISFSVISGIHAVIMLDSAAWKGVTASP
jgi:hypothetical protein